MRSIALCAFVLCGLAAAGPGPATRAFRFIYKASVNDLPEGASKVRLWVPVPEETPEQEIGEVSVTLTAGGGSVTKPAAELEKVTDVGGVPVRVLLRDITNGLGKSLYVETPGKPVALELSFRVKRSETQGGGEASEEELRRLLEPNAMIPLDGKVARIADMLESKQDTLLTAKELYDHVLETMRYDKPDDGGKWGRGDAEWACDARYGNCTDFHSYFMGLARKKGIPARFEMGFSIPGGDEKEKAVPGYHCWAYFWVDGRGWVPVDISDADRNPAKAEYLFGNLDADRFTMTGGRDLVLDPAPAAGPLNFFVYPYCEVDGKEHKKVERAFTRVLE
jgi:transglutaminase-like putative cysteine protease